MVPLLPPPLIKLVPLRATTPAPVMEAFTELNGLHVPAVFAPWEVELPVALMLSVAPEATERAVVLYPPTPVMLRVPALIVVAPL